MRCASEWIKNSLADIRTILICTDSQLSGIKKQAINNRSKDTDELRNKLEEAEVNTKIQWVPSHVNIPINEMADRIANEATSSENRRSRCLWRRRGLASKVYQGRAPSHPGVVAVYSKYSR